MNLCRSNSHAGVPQSFKWPDNHPYLNAGVAEQLQDVEYTVWLIVGTWPDVQCFSENCFFYWGVGVMELDTFIRVGLYSFYIQFLCDW